MHIYIYICTSCIPYTHSCIQINIHIYIYAYSVLDIPLFVLGINTVIDESCFVPKKEHQHFYADGHILWSKNLTLPARVSELKSLYN